MLLLIILALQIAATGASSTAPHGTSSYSSLPLPKVDILVSTSSKVALYSCFFTDDNIVEADLKSGKEGCCNGIVEAWQKVDDIYNSNNSINTNNDDDDDENKDSASDTLLHRRCMLEIAQVPSVVSDLLTTLKNNDNSDPNDGKENITPSAKFSWIVSNSIIISPESTTRQETTSTTSLKQYMWTNQSHYQQKDSNNEVKFQLQPIQTISPYHKLIVQSSMSMSNTVLPPMIATVEQNSYLDRDGGMHRLFHHSFQPIMPEDGMIDDETIRSFYLFVNIPQGMFIDLDDPFEASFSGTIESNPILSPDTDNINIDISATTTTTTTTSATSTYIVTNLNRPNDEKSSVLSFRAQLHSATLCDIEQPAFVSGQHVLVWEIDNIVTKTQHQPEIKNLSSLPPPPVIEFATKLHLRYPHPSSTLEEWIDLSSPLLFSVLPSSGNQLINKEESGDTSKEQQQKHHGWDLDFVERVWVAAGKDEDHDWIMTMTISFCLIGVVIMLRDISRVSLWDDA